jgi:hypothetical protein
MKFTVTTFLTGLAGEVFTASLATSAGPFVDGNERDCSYQS